LSLEKCLQDKHLTRPWPPAEPTAMAEGIDWRMQ